MSGIGTVVSARTASTRLFGKALLPLDGVPMVEFLLERIRDTRLGGQVIFATTRRADDDTLAAHVAALGIPVFRGADADVAGRHVGVAQAFGLEWIVRVTGDCPFVDAASLDFCLAQWNALEETDLISTKGVFPVGIDYELFSAATIAREWPRMSEEEQEHLTLRLYRPELEFMTRRFAKPPSWRPTESKYVVDTPEDYERAVRVVRKLGGRRFSIEDLLQVTDE
jgi:spore coat polysaccharide biosynthesis protein SpsF (cytidylyltransferase family)